MAHVRTANRHGTAKELADQEDGYKGSGLSMYTRRTANGRPYGGSTCGPVSRPPALLCDMISKQRMKLHKLRKRLLVAGQPADRLTKIRKDIEIKGKFLANLEAETAGTRQ